MRGPVRPWSDEEAKFLEENPGLSHVAAAKHLGRTPMSVQSRRYWMRKRGADVGSLVPADSKPQIGPRTLVAKTCSSCGLLLAGEWFARRAGEKRVRSRCRRCHGTVGRENRTDRYASAKQAETADQATRLWQEWTEADLRVIEREDLTAAEAAILIGRTHAAVMNARRTFALPNRTQPLSEPAEVWRVSR